jgi:Na+-transporting methylmalonyl-CoA/oxaloacetate decarboxylase gamma subunit
MVCQTIQNLALGPYNLESAQVCVSGTTSGTASLTLKVGPFTYSKTIPWGSVNPQQTLGTSAGRVYLIGTNPLSALLVDDILTISEYAQKVATALGYPGSFVITNVGLTNTSGCNNCVVYVDYVASSPPLAVALVIALVIIFVIAVVLGVYFISAAIESFQPSPPTPPPKNAPPSLYQAYYQEYAQYLQAKQTSSVSGAVFGTSTAFVVLGLGILAFLAFSQRGER